MMGVNKFLNYLHMKDLWCYGLPPLEEVTSVFWLHPKAMTSLNSEWVQKESFSIYLEI